MIVLYTKISQGKHDILMDKYSKIFPPDIYDRIIKFRKWEDAQRSLCGLILLLKGLDIYKLPSGLISKIQSNIYGKPYIQKNPLYFNISHSGEIVVCAFSKDVELGIDIEQMNEVSLDDFKENMLVSEWDKINKAEDRLYAFYDYWTQKEALIKAHGTGLNISLKLFEVINNMTFINDEAYYITKLNIRKGYFCNLASKTELRSKTIELIYVID
jgi:4'-phosphopantetheinyl transferase